MAQGKKRRKVADKKTNINKNVQKRQEPEKKSAIQIKKEEKQVPIKENKKESKNLEKKKTSSVKQESTKTNERKEVSQSTNKKKDHSKNTKEIVKPVKKEEAKKTTTPKEKTQTSTVKIQAKKVNTTKKVDNTKLKKESSKEKNTVVKKNIEKKEQNLKEKKNRFFLFDKESISKVKDKDSKKEIEQKYVSNSKKIMDSLKKYYNEYLKKFLVKFKQILITFWKAFKFKSQTIWKKFIKKIEEYKKNRIIKKETQKKEDRWFYKFRKSCKATFISLFVYLKKFIKKTFENGKKLFKKICLKIKEIHKERSEKRFTRKIIKAQIREEKAKVKALLPKKEKIKKEKKRKKKNRKEIFFIFVCILYCVFVMIPHGVSFYHSEASGKVLAVPKFIKLKEECCNFSATFTTVRSLWSLNYEMENIIKKYDILHCDGKDYYYNPEEDYTITEYGIHDGLIFNEIYITYGKGNSCDIDTTFKKLELLSDHFSLEDAKRDGNYVIDGNTVYNKSAYEEFIENVKNHVPSILRIVTTTREGDVIIKDLEYLSDGKYMVTYDGTRDRNNSDHRSIFAYKYEHLGISQNKLYAYNGSRIATENLKPENAYYLFDLS